jgi:excinuclease ABC subunit A
LSDESDKSDDSARTAVEGWESLGGVVAVDQSPLGRTPRSNPAVYIGAFDDIRAFFAQDEAARQRGLSASAFSFNSAQGQCERCRGAGFEKIEMQFLSDVFVRCPDCNGRRYRPHILEITVAGRTKTGAPRNWSIADVLDASVDEAIDFLGGFPASRPAARAVESLKLLQETGLGYLRVGQPVNTLSGGECQRLKLVSHLAQARAGAGTAGGKPVLFVFDEPTTGLHFEDVRVLLQVLQKLVDKGHTVLVIEHNLDVIRSADWLIDLGPEAGEDGGLIVAQGTPEQVAGVTESHTGQALAGKL